MDASKLRSVSRVGLLAAVLLVGLAFVHCPQHLRAQASCDGCERRALIEDIHSTSTSVGVETIRNRIVEGLLTGCFHFVSWTPVKDLPEDLRPYYGIAQKPPEYIIRAFYDEDREADVTAKLRIDLLYNGSEEELVTSWAVEADTKVSPWSMCQNRMFVNPSAVLRKVRPVELTVLNDFERVPKTCVVEPAKEEVMPGEEMEVEVNAFRDSGDRTSREFNRVIVQALEGEIIGGVGVEADPALKAFRVGDGKIRFAYKAPKDCRSEEDTIVVFNSCDILREDVYPLSRTGLKDKIAEKKVKIACADITLQIMANINMDHDEGRTRDVATSRAVIEGTMRLNRTTSVTETEVYEVDRMSCGYNLLYRVLEKSPRQGCPDLLTEITGKGQVDHRPSRSTSYLRIVPAQGSRKTATIKLSLSFEQVDTLSKRRKGTYPPNCQVYEDRPGPRPLSPSVYIEAESEVDQNGVLTGKLSRKLAGGEALGGQFLFQPILMQMWPGQEMTIEWRIVRRKR